MDEILSSLFKLLKENRELHARFVNTLSFMEYIGARKIFKSQDAKEFSETLLLHAEEEIRHARLLKRAALQMSDGKLDSYEEKHLLAGNKAEVYVQTVDQLGQEYRCTTWLLEMRAMDFYRKYQPVLAQAGYPHVIPKILSDETRHLERVTQEMKPSWVTFSAMEQKAFEKFLTAII